HWIFNQLLHDLRMNIAFKNAANVSGLGFRTSDFSAIIDDKSGTDKGVLCVTQCRDIEVQTDLSRTRNNTIDRIRYHGAMFMIDPGILQQLGQANLGPLTKHFLTMPAYSRLRIDAYNLGGRVIKCSDYAR